MQATTATCHDSQRLSRFDGHIFSCSCQVKLRNKGWHAASCGRDDRQAIAACGNESERIGAIDRNTRHGQGFARECDRSQYTDRDGAPANRRSTGTNLRKVAQSVPIAVCSLSISADNSLSKINESVAIRVFHPARRQKCENRKRCSLTA